jgi:hypothetical protein
MRTCSHSWRFIEIYQATPDGGLKRGKARCRHCETVAIVLAETQSVLTRSPARAEDFEPMELVEGIPRPPVPFLVIAAACLMLFAFRFALSPRQRRRMGL